MSKMRRRTTVRALNSRLVRRVIGMVELFRLLCIWDTSRGEEIYGRVHNGFSGHRETPIWLRFVWVCRARTGYSPGINGLS